ncbi:hypothetical protein D3H55_20260 [Bacillus salacetis]|uniref:Uncharacterized protein n=1 Tax=Bacillus salacetis TaxID=2315464 RepID=A0A3A1QP95_9BACI|nr:hypothetical protein [Bacillus salacetis]RIW28907.1 hypothetical protein D3H55_20260 [Bacillus salacetis]
MQINRMVRSYMVQIMNSEDFLKHVAETVERQLNEWDVSYKVLVMKLRDYELVIKNLDQEFQVKMTDQEVHVLHSTGLFKLDHKIWTELIKQGLHIQEGYGNYLSTVLEEVHE